MSHAFLQSESIVYLVFDRKIRIAIAIVVADVYKTFVELRKDKSEHGFGACAF